MKAHWKMRICLLGDISGNLDEGMKNTTYYLYSELSKSYEVEVVHPRKTLLPSAVLKFKPDILHYIHGSSIRSFLITRYLASIFPGSKSIVSATHPQFSKWEKLALGFFKPDLVLVQSKSMEDFFSRKGFKTAWLSGGVDVDKFSPVPKAKRLELRRKYGLEEDKLIVLHVGHVRPNRNLELLVPIQQQGGIQVVIAGSTTVRADERVAQRLKDAGCVVWVKYFPNIEELFQLADCYVFPVMTDNGAVQVPLTVLEAAACNLPVVTTPFGGLPDLVGEREGLFYVQTPEEMLSAVKRCRDCKVEPRRWAVEFSWEKIGKRLTRIYKDLIEEEKNA